MNHPNSLRSDQVASATDKPRLSGAHLSAVAPILERVKFIFNDPHAPSRHGQICESSSRLSYNFPRLLDPASFSKGNPPNLSNSIFGQEHVRNDDRSVSEVHYKDSKYVTHDTRPDEQSPAVDRVKSDYVTGKPLDGWLPAPSGLTRKGVAEKVTGQNLPQAFNKREDKSTSEDSSLKFSYQTASDVKSRASRWDLRVQGHSATEKPPWLMPYSVNDSLGRCSEGQRLAYKNAEGTCTSNEVRGLPVNLSASSLVTKPGHYSQVSERKETSVTIGQQRVEVDRRALNSTGHAEMPAWKPPATVGYDGASRANTGSADLSALTGTLPCRTGNAPYGDSGIVVARRSVQDPKRIEFQSGGQTLMVLKTGSDDLGASGYNSLELKSSRRREDHFDSRSRSYEKRAPPSKRESLRDIDRERQFSKRADPARKVDPSETRETSRAEFREEIDRRTHASQRNKEDSERKTSENKSRFLVYKEYDHRPAEQEPSHSDRRLSVERHQSSGGDRANDSLKLNERSKASAEEIPRKQEDRSRSKESKAITDEFLRNKFLLEIGRREKELMRVANNSGSPGISTRFSSIGVRPPHAATGTSHCEDDRERWPVKPEPKEPSYDSVHVLEPRAAVKRYESESTISHATETLSTGVVSSRMLQEQPYRREEVTADVLADRSRKLFPAARTGYHVANPSIHDKLLHLSTKVVTSKEVEDFKLPPLPPVHTPHRKANPSIDDTLLNLPVKNPAAADGHTSDTQSHNRNTKETVTLSKRQSSSSATCDSSSASDRNRTSASVRHKAATVREGRDGFLDEERVAYWENLKAQLEDQYMKRSPVQSQHRSPSEEKNDSRSKKSRLVNEAGNTPKSKNSEVHGMSRVEVEHTPNKDMQSKSRVKMENTSKTESKEEQSEFRVKMERTAQPAEERSSSQNKEAKQGIVKIQNRVPIKTKQVVRPHQLHSLNRSQKVSGQDKIEKQTVHPDQVHSVKKSQEVSGQDKTERQTVCPDNEHSLNRSQKVSSQDKVEGNVKSKQKMAPLRRRTAVGKTDSEQGRKGLIPKPEKSFHIPVVKLGVRGNVNQTVMQRKIVNRIASKYSLQRVTDANKNTRNSNVACFETAENEVTVLKTANKSDDLRNLLNSRPRNTNWYQREIRRQKDERSVILKDDVSSEEEELVIEVPGPRNRRTEDATPVGSGSRGRREIDEMEARRMNVRKWRGSDVEWRGSDVEFDSELPRKRFKFDENVSGRFARGRLGLRGRGSRAFEARSIDDAQRHSMERHSTDKIHFQGEFQHKYSDAVEFGADDDGADVDDRRLEQFGNSDEEGYFDTDDRNRISSARSRYRGKFRDRYQTGGNTREQYLDEEPIDQREANETDQYPGDVDGRFQRSDSEEYYEDGTKKYHQGNYGNSRSDSYSRELISRRDEERHPERESDRDSYDARYPGIDGQRRDAGDYDDDFSDNHSPKHLRQKRSSARYSNDDLEERYRGNRGARYTSDDEKEPYLSHQYGTDTEEHFDTENYSRADVEEQGSFTNRPARHMRKPGRGSFKNPRTHTITSDKLKGPRAFLKELEQDSVAEYAQVERPCDIEVTVGGDLYEDRYAWDATGYQEDEEAASDVDFEDNDDRTDSRGFDDETAPLSSDEHPRARTRFGGPSRGSSFQTRSLRGRLGHKSVRGFQSRLGYRGRFGLQPHRKKFLPTPRKFLRRMVDPESNLQSEDNVPEASSSIQEAMKQIMSNIKEAEMADPEADAELYDTLSWGEKKQVIEIQRMTGIQCITAIVTALRTLWEFEPKVVRTLGSLEPAEIKQLGDDN